uniref:Uncharacterized protein n=1 Tax=Moniliophthora roreri TaxID=221103 RepID=A0A0W0EYD2_MONRR
MSSDTLQILRQTPTLFITSTTSVSAVSSDRTASMFATAANTTLTQSDIPNSNPCSSASSIIGIVALWILVLLAVLTMVGLGLAWRRRRMKKDFITEIPTPYPLMQKTTAWTRTKLEARERIVEGESRRANFHRHQSLSDQRGVVSLAELSRLLMIWSQSSRRDPGTMEPGERNPPPEYALEVS